MSKLTRESIEGAIRTITKAGCLITEQGTGEEMSYLINVRPDVAEGNDITLSLHMMMMFAQGIDIGRLASINTLKNEL